MVEQHIHNPGFKGSNLPTAERQDKMEGEKFKETLYCCTFHLQLFIIKIKNRKIIL